MTDTTHADGCWSWGQEHYECAVREIKALLMMEEREQRDEALLRQALEYLERSADNYPIGHALSRQSHENTITAIKERLK